MRIEAKKLRYATELASVFPATKAQKRRMGWLETWKRCSTRWGIHDQASVTALLDEFGISAAAMPFNRAAHDTVRDR